MKNLNRARALAGAEFADLAAALAAFESRVNRTDLDGTPMLAVLNQIGAPVAHHDFRVRPDGSPILSAKYWRGLVDKIKWPALAK